ncbi:MAG: hypothetical protein Q8S54_19820 [Bacteroidota bacterium]|nr:hypothetical protein [Bacteroidota bacterium]
MKAQPIISIDQIIPEHRDKYQKTIDSILKKTGDFINNDLSDDIVESLAKTMKLISLEYQNWFNADEAFEQIYAIGCILEFMKSSKLDFKNVEFYLNESKNN